MKTFEHASNAMVETSADIAIAKASPAPTP